MSPVKVVLADDHEIVRNGIKTLLESEGEIEVLGEASNGIEAIEKVLELKPEILILDIRMPLMNGIEATAKLREVSPDTKVLILSMHDDEEYIIKSAESGASGYLLKDTNKQEFIKAISTIKSGDKYFSGDISNILVNNYLNIKKGNISNKNSNSSDVTDYGITKREKQILNLIYNGVTNKDIAEQLGKSVRTIETHRFNIMKKLGVGNITELLRKVDMKPDILG
ncbi:response regulator transcription factor [Reichenbachiella sp. MALMAid0571]|uniref:response regulator transcription factor n=1 Tax=Reichenbachiella sp. MALMAid0571 TaxID=3143939 RepID=UPI0032DECEA6